MAVESQFWSTVIWFNLEHRRNSGSTHSIPLAATIANLQALKGRIEGNHCITAFGKLPLRLLTPTQQLEDHATITFGVRASSLTVSSGGACSVQDIRFLGDRYTLLVSAENQELEISTALKPTAQIGDAVSVNFASAEALMLS